MSILILIFILSEYGKCYWTRHWGLTMIPLLDEASPDKIAKSTEVRIGVETSTSEETQDKDKLSGNIPGIRLFDVAG
ncbi:hypothetical protein BOTCAL_0237g00100 [Botryotinia calthae]|uniref:Uncharacterized protein n=1 Tax=Botryotinia calthae TaxID=38488 RepID=A0A4Y8CXC5_9HELO|nr:hypothetical protein BOTCAL_0237g00100 [Botryotinia calthae]